jgi:predicted Zn-dependent peptidase
VGAGQDRRGRRLGRAGGLNEATPVCEAGWHYATGVQSWRLTELDSGERVISERLDHVRSAAVGYWIGAGSRDEEPAEAGVTHFIEHMLFKGSERYSALEIAEIFDGLGGELNAATSREHTLVYARIPDHHLVTAVDVMGDMVFAPAFAELDSEREVVLEEIAMYDDAPQELVHDLIAEAVFGDHPLGRPVIGTSEVISSIPREAIARYHGAMYVPGNIVVAAAGNVDHDEVVELVSRALERRGPAADSVNLRPPLVQAPPPMLRFQQKDTEQYHVCLAAPGISRSDRRRFAVSLLDAILGGSASSRLFQEIREKRGMAYAVYSFVSQYTDTGQIGVYLGTREDNLAEALAITAEQIADIAGGNLPARELERAKENIRDACCSRWSRRRRA